MRLCQLQIPIAAIALAFAGACAGPTGPETTTESRGALTVTVTSDGDLATAEVSISDTGQLVASLDCETSARALRVDAALAGESSERALPDGMTCTSSATMDLAFIIGDELASAPPLTSDADVVEAYDGAGCDVIGGANSCCARHDACYAAYDCSAWSWLYLWGDCDKCNRDVVTCLLT
jgi:hypothetical protein